MRDITVLLTGAGAPGAPGILQCYRNNGERNIRVIGVDIRDRVPTIRMLDRFYQVPRPSSKGFISTLLDIARCEAVDVIQPLVTRELVTFASYKQVFADSGIAVCCADEPQLRIANNKRLLLDFMTEHGMAVPAYRVIRSADAFELACRELGYPNKPVCFKPSEGNGSRGFRILDSKKDLSRLLFEEKPNSTYGYMEQILQILHSMRELPELLVMEFLPGDEYSVDVLADQGNILVAIPRRRLAMNGGISTDCVVEYQDDVIEYCREIVEQLSLNGNIGIQVRADWAGKYKILEINPRVQGSIVSCAAAGANLPYLSIKQALGESIGEITVRWGTEMMRYWNEVYYDSAGHAFAYNIL